MGVLSGDGHELTHEIKFVINFATFTTGLPAQTFKADCGGSCIEQKAGG